jgi:hypothetical protein
VSTKRQNIEGICRKNPPRNAQRRGSFWRQLHETPRANHSPEKGLVPMLVLQLCPLYFADLLTPWSPLLTGILLLVSLAFGLVPDNLEHEYQSEANVPTH